MTRPSSRNALTCSTTCATAAGRSSSSPTTWPRCSASVTGRYCWSAASRCTWASRTRSPTAIWSSTSAARGRRSRRRRPHRRRSGSRGRGVARGRDGQRLSSAAQQQRVTLMARVMFNVDVVDPAATVQIFNDEHRMVLVATTELENERSGHFRSGEEVRGLVHVRQRAGARPLRAGVPADASRLRPGRDRPVRGQLLLRRHGRRPRWAGSSTCPCSQRSAAPAPDTRRHSPT